MQIDPYKGLRYAPKLISSTPEAIDRVRREIDIMRLNLHAPPSRRKNRVNLP